MAQIFWEQIKDLLPSAGKQLTGSLKLSGSIFYNGQELDSYITSQLVTGSNNWNTITNKPANLFSGSFIAGNNISISQSGQNITITATDSMLPAGVVSGSSQINFLGLSGIPSGLISSSTQILPITTASIVNFTTNVENVMGNAYVESTVEGNFLLFTRQNGSSDYVNLGDIVPSTPTGSLVYSGSFNSNNTVLTLYRADGNVDINLASLANGGGSGITSVVAGNGLIGGGITGDLTLTANVSSTYGTEIVSDFIGIATGSLRFVDGVVKAGLFRQTGSYWSTTNDLKITGSLGIQLDGNTDEFSIAVTGSEKVKVNSQGVFQFVAQTVTPTAVPGGIFYSGSDAFYIGFNN